MFSHLLPLDHPRRKFPDLCIRPARACDFPKMARMASKVFQHERDLDYFEKHRSVKMADEAEAEVIDELLAAEREWRYSNMRANYDRPGRHFMVATCLKRPAEFMTVRHRRSAKEVMLGWAEWQDPGQTMPAPAPKEGLDGGEKQEGSLLNFPWGHLDSVIRSLSFVHQRNALLVPPNGLAVNMHDALRSFTDASDSHHDEWHRWSTQLMPMCFGQEGDVDGQNLVLRSLVIHPIHWDDFVGRRLLNWGVDRARANGWAIQAIASAIGASTLSSFQRVGFVEKGRLDIFRDMQIHLRYEHVREPAWMRPLESRLTCPTPIPCCVAEAQEKQDGEL